MFEFGIIPPLMFFGMVIFMLYGFPVAFSLAAVGMFFGMVGIATGHFQPIFLELSSSAPFSAQSPARSPHR